MGLTLSNQRASPVPAAGGARVHNLRRGLLRGGPTPTVGHRAARPAGQVGWQVGGRLPGHDIGEDAEAKSSSEPLTSTGRAGRPIRRRTTMWWWCE